MAHKAHKAHTFTREMNGFCANEIKHVPRVVEDNMGAAPLALPRRAPRHAGALGIMMGIPTQPFRAGLTFSGRPSGPRWDLGKGLKPVRFEERLEVISGTKTQTCWALDGPT